jgi:AcrR family transcriptional regulator
MTGTIRPPLQERARRSLHRILDATTVLLAERSFDEISIDEIVERAGYTKGAFYHRFDGKADLLRHLIRRLTDGALEAWADFLAPEAWEGKGLAPLVEAMIRRLVAIYTRSGNVMRAFAYEVHWGNDPELRAIAAELNGRVSAAFLDRVVERSEQLAPAVRDDPEGAIRYWLAALTATLQATLLWPDDSFGAPTPKEAVEERVVSLLAPYLVADWPTRGTADTALP